MSRIHPVTAPELCINVSHAVLFDSNGKTYTIYTQSDMCIYTYILQNIEVCRAKEIYKLGQQ
jgi:hypothetical protein